MAPQYVDNIAIVGASGSVGKHIVQELLKAGKTVTAITREDSSNPMPDGVAVKKVNYEDAASLSKAMEGQQALIITMAVTAPPEASAKLIQAAAEANVSYVFLNEYGIDHQDESVGKDVLLGPPQVENRKLVERLGKSAWMAITCSFWYEYSLAFGEPAYGIDIRKKEAIFFDDGEKWINASTWEQCGRAIASVFSFPISSSSAPEGYKGAYVDDFRNSAFHISSFRVSQRTILDSILKVTGDKESDWSITKVDAKKRYKEAFDRFTGGSANKDRTDFGRLLYTRMFFPDNAAQYDPVSNKVLGLKEEDLDERTKVAIEMATGQ